MASTKYSISQIQNTINAVREIEKAAIEKKTQHFKPYHIIGNYNISNNTTLCRVMYEQGVLQKEGNRYITGYFNTLQKKTYYDFVVHLLDEVEKKREIYRKAVIKAKEKKQSQIIDNTITLPFDKEISWDDKNHLNKMQKDGKLTISKFDQNVTKPVVAKKPSIETITKDSVVKTKWLKILGLKIYEKTI